MERDSSQSISRKIGSNSYSLYTTVQLGKTISRTSWDTMQCHLEKDHSLQYLQTNWDQFNSQPTLSERQYQIVSWSKGLSKAAKQKTCPSNKEET
jgi:hypothetical protein